MIQQTNESVEKYMSRFKNAQSRCYTPLKETEYVKIVQNGINLDLKKKFDSQGFPNLFQLTFLVVNHETILMKEDQKKITQETYHIDSSYDILAMETKSEKINKDLEMKMDVTIYIYRALTKPNNSVW